MRLFSLAIAGLVSGSVFVLLVGFLHLRIRAAEEGVTLDIRTNEILHAVAPHVPIAALVGIAVIGAIAVFSLMLCAVRLEAGSAVAFNVGFAVAALALVVVAFWDPAPVLGLDHLPYGGGWLGWVRHGGREAVVLVVALVAASSLLFRRFGFPRNRIAEEALEEHETTR